MSTVELEMVVQHIARAFPQGATLGDALSHKGLCPPRGRRTMPTPIGWREMRVGDEHPGSSTPAAMTDMGAERDSSARNKWERREKPMAAQAKASIDERFLTVAEVAERLKVNDDTVRRLFANEPGVLVICFPRRGRRVYRTLRIPTSVFERVLTRLTKVA